MTTQQIAFRSVGSSPWRLGFVLIALTFACLAVTSTLTMADGNTTNGNNGHEESFSGTVSGTIPPQSQWIPDPTNPCVFTIMGVTNTGTSNLLGQFHGMATFVPNVCDGSYTGTYEWIAANGDRISGPFRGQNFPTATAGVVSNVETATITGGTGRFKHASGTFTLYGIIDYNTLTFVVPWLGTLSPNGH
ncbi:MAG TPA: hypothetical protein VFQ78_11185 [Candidatus Udaeobacter sp.]|nr:hypothetical protein [Candidatus Udaeobacter sp.]